jgi:hypothetical protein
MIFGPGGGRIHVYFHEKLIFGEPFGSSKFNPKYEFSVGEF